MKEELRDGVAETIPFLLSHHARPLRNRCHHVTILGRDVHLCSRCSGIYPGILAGLLFPVRSEPLLLIAVLPLPALVDWAVTSTWTYRGSNAVRTATGLLLGYGYALGLIRVLVDGDLSVLLVGSAYGTVAVWLLYTRTAGDDRREDTI